jgi:hypothetical protein
MFDFAHKTLDQMPLTIQPSVVFTQDFSPLMGWNNGFNAAVEQIFDEMCRRIAPIGNQMLEIKAFQQKVCLSNVVTLTCGQTKTQGIAQALYRDMDFATKAPTTASEGLRPMFFWAPAAHG